MVDHGGYRNHQLLNSPLSDTVSQRQPNHQPWDSQTATPFRNAKIQLSQPIGPSYVQPGTAPAPPHAVHPTLSQWSQWSCFPHPPRWPSRQGRATWVVRPRLWGCSKAVLRWGLWYRPRRDWRGIARYTFNIYFTSMNFDFLTKCTVLSHAINPFNHYNYAYNIL